MDRYLNERLEDQLAVGPTYLISTDSRIVQFVEINALKLL